MAKRVCFFRKNPIFGSLAKPHLWGMNPLPLMPMTEQEQLNYKRVAQAIRYLEQHFRQQPTLEEIAEAAAVSPFHFQRLFTEWAGISPKRFLQFLTVDFLKARLRHSPDLFDAAEAAGLSGPPRVHELFTTLEAVTVAEYKREGKGLEIRYGFHETPFGKALLGSTDRGICWLSFVPTDAEPRLELEKMKQFWNQSLFQGDESLTGAMMTQVFQTSNRQPLHVLVKGTNFQVKVWQALLQLPFGDVTTYQQIAAEIEKPSALQAVGSAVGANHIAYLIPCHRVIRKDGHLGGYRWESVRKKCILGWELAQRLGQV
jgi:AraC family transcriptional regulator of adaptative response/methylated-DNA-[protein]-cysteine methyltransferase